MSASATTKGASAPTQPTKKKGSEMKTSEHPLAYAIPDADWHTHYISRDIAGVNDLNIFASAHRLKHNLLLSGPTGSAKTSVTYAYASKVGLPVVNIPCNGAAEPSLFIGKWNKLPNGQFDFVLGELALAVLHGGVILLDEINFLKPNIGAYLHGLLDSRRTLVIPEASGSSAPTFIKAHPDCLIVGAYNPNYQGTRPLNEAFKNRFAFQVDFPYLNEVESSLIQSESLIQLANNLRLELDAGNLTTPISTNLLIETEELACDEELGFDFALTNFLNHFPLDEQQPVKEVLVQIAPNVYNELFGEPYPSDGLFNPIH
jgi:hypothetical protein